MMANQCRVCHEDKIIPRQGYFTGRACKCDREKKEQAKQDKLKPRCAVQIADRGVYVEQCGDHADHEGPHGQTLVQQVMK